MAGDGWPYSIHFVVWESGEGITLTYINGKKRGTQISRIDIQGIAEDKELEEKTVQLVIDLLNNFRKARNRHYTRVLLSGRIDLLLVQCPDFFERFLVTLDRHTLFPHRTTEHLIEFPKQILVSFQRIRQLCKVVETAVFRPLVMETHPKTSITLRFDYDKIWIRPDISPANIYSLQAPEAEDYSDFFMNHRNDDSENEEDHDDDGDDNDDENSETSSVMMSETRGDLQVALLESFLKFPTDKLQKAMIESYVPEDPFQIICTSSNLRQFNIGSYFPSYNDYQRHDHVMDCLIRALSPKPRETRYRNKRKHPNATDLVYRNHYNSNTWGVLPLLEDLNIRNLKLSDTNMQTMKHLFQLLEHNTTIERFYIDTITFPDKGPVEANDWFKILLKMLKHNQRIIIICLKVAEESILNKEKFCGPQQQQELLQVLRDHNHTIHRLTLKMDQDVLPFSTEIEECLNRNFFGLAPFVSTDSGCCPCRRGRRDRRRRSRVSCNCQTLFQDKLIAAIEKDEFSKPCLASALFGLLQGNPGLVEFLRPRSGDSKHKNKTQAVYVNGVNLASCDIVAV